MDLIRASLVTLAWLSSISLAETPAATAISPREIFRRSLSDVSGDIFLLPEAYNYLLDTSDFQADALRISHIASHHDGKVDIILPPHPMSMHGYAWDYDLRIPLAFYDPNARWFKAGRYANVAVQQDIAPTLADVLGVAAPDHSEGRILSEARQPATNQKPRLVAIIVQDQMGWQYFAAHPQRLKFIRGLLERSASFTNAQVAHVDVETSVGHAAIGTGAYARGHGITANMRWHPGLWAAQPVYVAQLTESLASEAYPLELGAATLADVWLKARHNQPQVLSLVSAARASLSLGGHGAMFAGNKKTAVLYFADHGKAAGTFTTDPNFYFVPESVKDRSVRPYAEAFDKERGGAWFGNRLSEPDGTVDLKIVRASPAQVRFESDLVRDSVHELDMGKHEDTDLLFVNFKSSDYCGHLFGYESEECGDVLDAVDAAIGQLITQLEQTTHGDMVVTYTADHGAAPLPELSGGLRYDRNRLQADLNARFAPAGSRIEPVPFIGASQLWVNRQQLARNGYTIGDVVAYLRAYEVPLVSPWNMLAKDWLARGKPAKQRFFRDVVSRESLLLSPTAGSPTNKASAQR